MHQLVKNYAYANSNPDARATNNSGCDDFIDVEFNNRIITDPLNQKLTNPRLLLQRVGMMHGSDDDRSTGETMISEFSAVEHMTSGGEILSSQLTKHAPDRPEQQLWYRYLKQNIDDYQLARECAAAGFATPHTVKLLRETTRMVLRR